MSRRLLITLLVLLSVAATVQAADVNKDLRKAAEKCDLARLHQLLAKGAEVNDKDDKGLAALMLAAGKGCAEVVQALLDAGADVEAKDNNGLTAAMWAERNGYADIVKLLNMPRSKTTEDGNTIPCASIKIESGGKKGKQERFFAAPMKRVREVVIDAMSATGFVFKEEQQQTIEAVRKYPELSGDRRSLGEQLLLTFETVEQSGSSRTRVTAETKSGGFWTRTIRQKNWTDAVLDQAECVLSLFDFRTDEEILAESAAHPDNTGEQAGQKIVLPDGALIKLRLRRYFSANDEEGRRIAFEVTDEVLVDGKAVIKKGTIAWGHVTSSKKSKNFNRDASLDFTIDYVKAVNGQNIPLRSYREELGGVSKAKIAATVAGGGVLGGLLTKGKNVGVRAGTAFVVFIYGDQSVRLKAEPD